MLIKIDTFDPIFFDFTDFARLKQSYSLKGASDLFDSSRFRLIVGYFLYLKHNKMKGNEKMFEITGV